MYYTCSGDGTLRIVNIYLIFHAVIHILIHRHKCIIPRTFITDINTNIYKIYK